MEVAVERGSDDGDEGKQGDQERGEQEGEGLQQDLFTEDEEQEGQVVPHQLVGRTFQEALPPKSRRLPTPPRQAGKVKSAMEMPAVAQARQARNTMAAEDHLSLQAPSASQRENEMTTKVPRRRTRIWKVPIEMG